MRVILAQPRGFCAGVERAICIVEQLLGQFGKPVYVRHEIVHNRHVVSDLEAKGAIFVDDLNTVPEGSVTVFSAHGVPRSAEETARARRLDVFDATCPLVTKVHVQGRRYAAAGHTIVLIGHAGHVEVEGTMGQIPGTVKLVSTIEDVQALEVDDPERLAYVTQTTLSVDDTKLVIGALRARFPAIIGPETKDICYATQNRQHAVRELAKVADVILVVGSKSSSNSNRLQEIGAEQGVDSYLIDDATELNPAWLQGKRVIGITAGASAPDTLVDQLVETIRHHHDGEDIELSVLSMATENVRFRLPARLTA